VLLDTIALVFVLLDTKAHQGRENIASHPLKIIAISVIFCGNFQKNSPSYIAFSRNFSAENLYSSTSFLSLAQYFF
jgi:hypothetical protein